MGGRKGLNGISFAGLLLKGGARGGQGAIAPFVGALGCSPSPVGELGPLSANPHTTPASPRPFASSRIRRKSSALKNNNQKAFVPLMEDVI